MDFFLDHPVQGFRISRGRFIPINQVASIRTVKMKCSMLSAIALLVLCVATCCIRAADEPGPPETNEIYISLPQKQVEFSQDLQHLVVDLGPVECGKRAELSVILRNKTLTDFGPLEGKSSCSCLVGVMKDQTVIAGGETEIRIRLATPAEPRKTVQRLELKSKSDGRRLGLQLSIDARRSVEIENNRFALPLNKNEMDFDVVLKPQLQSVDMTQLDVRSLNKQLSIKNVECSEPRGNIVARCSAVVAEKTLEGQTTLLLQVVSKSPSYAFTPVDLPLEIYAADLWRLKPTIMSFYQNGDVYECKFFLFNPGLERLSAIKLSGAVDLNDGAVHQIRINDIQVKARVLTGVFSISPSLAASLGGKEFKVAISADGVNLAKSVGQVQPEVRSNKE